MCFLLSIPLLFAQEGAVAAPEDLSAQFDLPPGVRAQLWAESPLLYNPTAIDVDAQGRVWVAEAVNYRQWNGRNPGRHHHAGDRIMVLEDSDGDGAADRATIFAQDADLTAPLGIAVIGDRVYVSCSPALYVYRDVDGDLRADQREVLLTGFGGHDHDHGLHSVVAAADGSLLWSVGNAGPHLVQDADGLRLRSGSIYNGGGASNPANRPGLRSDDGRVWTGGLIGALRSDGGALRVLAHNFRNQYEVASDSFGNLYTADNDDDGNQSCRTVALTAGGNYGYFSADGARSWQVDRRPGQDTQSAHWHQEDPGVMPAGTINGAGGPTGVVVYEGSLMPALHGNIFNADAGRSLVYAHRPRISGAQMELEAGVLIQPAAAAGGERRRWFRPSDVAVGPDGSIYVADWYDPGVGGHQAGDRDAYGRILRLAPEHLQGYGAAPAGIDSPAPNVRGAAVATWSQDAQELAAAAPGDNTGLARRLWPWAADPTTRSRAEAALDHPDARVRLTAYRALLAATEEHAQLAQRMVADPSAWVRAHVAASLRDLEWEQCQDLLLQFATLLDADDRTALESLGLGASGKEDALFTALLAAGGEGSRSERLLALAWRLHPESARPFLLDQLSDPSRPLAQRRRALDALAHLPSREAAESMVGLALAGPDELRGLAGWWVRRNADLAWKNYGLAGTLAGDYAESERVWSSAPLSEGSEELEIDVRNASVVWLEVEDAGDGNSYDWAVWLHPHFETESGAIPLTELEWSSAEAQWGEVHRNRSCDGSPLRVGGAEVANGIGTHAHSRISVAVPAGATRLLAACAADDGGLSQNGSNTSLRFAVQIETRAEASADVEGQQRALNGETDAAVALADSVAGALFLLEKTRSGELPDAVRAALRAPLQDHRDLSVRALASELYPRTTPAGQELPALIALAAMQGDVGRGQLLFQTTATCSVCHSRQGLGGAIGPDLTAIASKYGRTEVLDAMLNPSAAIAFGYDSWTLVMKDGRRLAGAILADGERVVLRDLSGRRMVLAADEIESRTQQALSTMPPATTLGLGAQQLADLTTFLLDDPRAEPRFGEEVALFNGSDLGGWSWQLPAGADPQALWSVRDGVLRCEGKPAGYLYTEASYANFELTLEWRFDPAEGPGNSGVLLRVQEPHKVWPRSIEAQLHSGNAGDIWNIDKVGMRVESGRTSGRRTVKLLPSNEKPLGEWNHYRIRMDHGELHLVVNGDEQNHATWCEESAGAIALQSEGAVIEFRHIRLRPILD